MNYYDEIEEVAAKALADMLSRPMPKDSFEQGMPDKFSPWDLFPALYGGYSSEFDDLAIDVLTDIRDMTHKREDLASEMFKEMLCTGGFCDYGTSPRVCFAATHFSLTIGRLIEMWVEYRSIVWGDQA